MSSSKSSSAQQTTSTDNRRVLAENSISAEGSNVNVWNTSLDAEVLNRAMKSVDLTTGEAFAFGGDALTGALGFGKTALTMAGNTVSDALGLIDSQSTRNASLLGNAYSDLIASQDTAVGKVLTYGGNLTNRVLDATAATENLVKDAYADAKGRGALTDKIMIGAIAAMALVAFAAVKK